MNELKTLDTDTKEAPKSRIGDGATATGMVFNMLEADMTRAQQRTKIKGLYDGNAPYNRAEMKAKGMGNNTNLNFLQARATVNQFKTPYYDLVVEVPMLADIQTSFGKPQERADWSQIISEEYHRMVTGWRGWDDVVQKHQFQMLLNGIGVCFFHDDVDWRPDVCGAGECLVPDGTSTNIDEIEAVAVLKNYAPHKLYRYIRNKEQASTLGWNVPYAETSIIESRTTTNEPPTSTQQVEWYQQKFKNADIFYGTSECSAIRAAHLIVSEFDGSVSHHIVRADKQQGDFLFTKPGRFSSIENAICPFFYDIGDGTWHSVRGLGNEIYAYCETFNRLRCREVDGAMIASTVMLQQKDASTATKAQLLTVSNLGILPPGMSFVPTPIGQGIEATVSVRRDMEQGLNQNIGALQSSPGSNTKREGQKAKIMDMQQKAQLNKGNINRYYTAYDRLHQQMFRRASARGVSKLQPGGKEAAEFQQRCLDRKVPREALEQIDSVHAMRSIGAGSAVNALMVTESLMEHAGSYPEDGRKLIIRDYTARLAGGKFADRYCGEMSTDSYKTMDDSIAQLENDALRNGGKCLITIEQSHVIHLKSHIGDCEEHLKEFQEASAQTGQQDTGEMQHLFLHLDSSGKHCADHLEQLKNDAIRKGDYSELYKRWRQLAQIQDQVKQQLEEAMQAQQEQQAQAAGQPGAGDNAEFLKTIAGLYDKAPEGFKAHVEEQLGVPRQEGELSVPAQKLRDAELKTQLKAQGQQAKIAHDDVALASQIRKSP